MTEQTHTGHSLFAPSKAHRWLHCAASLALEEGIPDTSSIHAEEGTYAHAVAASVLDPMLVPPESDPRFELDPVAMNSYVDAVRRAHGEQGILLVEQRIPFGTVVGVPEDIGEQSGTADAIVYRPDLRELQVHDLKWGRGVRVEAAHNPQLLLYAVGAIYQYDVLGNIETVRVAIHQPRLDHYDEHVLHVNEIEAFIVQTRQAVQRALQFRADMQQGIQRLEADWYAPGEDTCRWCKAKTTCPALRKLVDETVAQAEAVPGADTDTLAHWMALAGLVEDFIKAVRAEVEARLLAGQSIPGWKLVEGRKGARKWTDEAAVTALFKKFRLKVEDMYDMKLISPAGAEKLLGESRRWSALVSYIRQDDGKPSVAPESDKRPAINAQATVDDFDDVSGQ